MNQRVLLLLLLLCALPGRAQQRVTGRVLSAATRMPLPGASVLLKGSRQGTMTDADGQFTLPSVPAEAVLQVQFLGYVSQEVRLPSPLAQPLEIALAEDATALGEVVVSTGYQTLPQERATGSFAQVSRERLQEQVGPDVVSRLAAVANGLTVDRGTDARGRLLVRGLSTLMGPRDPLVVVDNFPYEGSLDNLNPNDVESVTILKDAAAASIWGARAGNGVLVITTKRGRFRQPLQVEVNANATVVDEPDLSYAPQMSSADFIAVEQLLYARGYYNSTLNAVTRPAVTPVVELLRRQAQGTLSAAEAAAQLEALRQVDVRDEFTRSLYRRGLNQQYSLALRGGAEQHAWRLAVGVDRNRSPLEAHDRRLNLHAQQTLRPGKKLELSTTLYLTLARNTSGKPGYGEVSMLNGNLYPYAQLADAAGRALPVVKDYRQSFKETAGGGQLLDWNYYPLEDWRHSRSTYTRQEVRADAGLRYQLPWGLEAEVRYQYQRQQSSTAQEQDAQSYQARSLVNLYTRVDPATGAVTYRVPPGGILDLAEGLVEAHSGRGQLNLNRHWGNHELTALAGAELRTTRTTGHSSRRYGYDGSTLTFGQVDATTPYPLLTSGRTSFIPAGEALQRQQNRFVSLYGNAAYTLRRRYTVSASARRDASNLFGVQANDRWNPLWSTGLSWNVAEERFYRLALLPTLRLRATYGFSGSVDPGRTAVATLSYRPTVSPYTGAPVAYFSNYANPDLGWETTGMLNLGLDFGFRGDRVTGKVEFFRKRGRDLFGWAQLDYTAGIGSSVVKNVARMEGRGLELELNTVNVRAGTFEWSSHLNASHARDRVTAYYLSDLQGSNFISTTPAVSGVVGRPVYALFSYRWAGLDPATGNPRGFWEGAPSQDYLALTGAAVQVGDLRYHGSAVPTFFGSLGNTLTRGAFSLTARLTYKLGYFFRRPSIHYSDLFRLGTMHRDYAARWQQPGDEAHTDVPALSYPANTFRDRFYAGSEVLVERGDHVRLQYLSASYDFPRKGGRRLPFQQLTAYVNVQNLGILWRANRQGLDPDYYLDRHALPPARSYALGLRASF